MIPPRYRRLWRRRLRRRPLLPFLLAATLAVDLVIVALFVVPVDQLSLAAFFAKQTLAAGFLEAQLGLAAAWTALGSGPLAVRMLIGSFACAGVAALLVAPAGDEFVTLAWLLLTMLVVEALVCAGLSKRMRSMPRMRRRLTLAGLLAWMPTVAMLASTVRTVEWRVLAELPAWTVALNFVGQAAVLGACLAAAWRIRSVRMAALLVAAVTLKVSVVLVLARAIGGAPLGDAIGGELPRQLVMATVLFTWFFGLRSRSVAPVPVASAKPADKTAAAISESAIDVVDASTDSRTLRYDPAHPSVLKMHLDLRG